MRVLELFCGIGAVSSVTGSDHEIIASIDINLSAKRVFSANFDTPFRVCEITSLARHDLEEAGADLWWMSPPCQPFTRRGHRRDLEDPRNKALLYLIGLVAVAGPEHLALENVVGFEGSQTHALLQSTLVECGYKVNSVELCSTQFGLPNRRPRYFLAASRSRSPGLFAPPQIRNPKPLRDFLESPDGDALEQLKLNPALAQKYADAINVVGPDSLTSRCFTSAYGRSPVRSGSYLDTGRGLRMFSPREQLRLLGFTDDFLIPADLDDSKARRLIGNSLSIPCVRYVLSSFDR